MVGVWQIFALVIAPTVFWGAYFYYKDRYKPEPISRLLISYALGFGSAFIAIGFYWIVDNLLNFGDPNELMVGNRSGFFLYAITVIGPVEELAKLIPFLLVCVRFRHFDERIDGIIYASMIALGFATMENIRHLDVLEGPLFYAHAFAAPIVHCCFSAVWGVLYAVARSRKTRFGLTVSGFAASAFLHGLFDYIATDAVWTSASAGVVLALWIAGIVLIKRFRKEQLTDK